MVLWWDIPVRRDLEVPTLRCYHAALEARGVTDYTFERLIEDYRLCIAEALAVAVEWCVLEEDRERMRWLWNRELERGMVAYEDWRCDELWR
jgi:hypothetical protein